MISYFVCQNCGTQMPIPRDSGKQRKHGHIKHIWCPCCKKKMKFKEIKHNENYKTMSGELIIF